MKKALFTLLLGMMIISSCSDNSNIYNVSENYTEDDIIMTRNESISMSELEIHMQWISYSLAEILKDDPVLRDRFFQLYGVNMFGILSLEHGAVLLSDLLAYEDGLFRAAISDNISQNLESELKNLHLPVPVKNKPPRPPRGKNAGAIEYGPFVVEFVENECLEVYFPLGLNLTHDLDIVSTAHPLNIDDRNIGYVQYNSPFLNEDSEMVYVLADIIGEPEVTLNQNVIVTRPIRNSFSLNCNYSEYNDIDFSEFLLMD